MDSSHSRNPGSFPNLYWVLLSGLMLLVSFYDLVAPPIATTVWRQAQTALITENFAKNNFSLEGLYVGLRGNEKLMMVYEFPIYNFITGLLFKIFNTNPIWGKLVSLGSALVTLIILVRLVSLHAGNRIATVTGLFFVLIPINVLMFTAFQPDALGVMFIWIAVYLFDRWRKSYQLRIFILCCVMLLFCGLCKFPILIPFIPLFGLIYFFPHGTWRRPKISEILSLIFVFLVPFLSWYIYRARLIDPVLLGVEGKMFFLGDLSRFVTLSYYKKPFMMYVVMVWCVAGLIYFAFGLRRLNAVYICLLAGVPLYYIIIPTTADQAYYIYPLGAFMAIFMAKGSIFLWDYLSDKGLKFCNYFLASGFALCSIFGITYLLRQDTIIYEMGRAVQQSTRPEDLIFAINMHDRGVWVGGYNPSVAYFTQRNGWNIQNFNAYNFQNTLNEINSSRKLGAKWLVISWYTPATEPWYTHYLPKQFSRRPLFDSEKVADELKGIFKTVVSTQNYAVLDLRQGENRVAKN